MSNETTKTAAQSAGGASADCAAVGAIRNLIKRSEAVLSARDYAEEDKNARNQAIVFLSRLEVLRAQATDEARFEEFAERLEHATEVVGDARRARLLKVYRDMMGPVSPTRAIEVDA